MLFKNLNCRSLTASLALAAAVSGLHAQVNYYECADKGYITNTYQTAKGIVATTNKGSQINLIENGVMRTLVSSPGAGMYINVSKDGKLVGFKSINSNAEQAPAIYDIATGRVTMLEPYADQCGQVSFADDGTMAYTVGNTLYIRKGDDKKSFDLGFYVNIANISPDAKSVAYTSQEGELYIKDLNFGATKHFFGDMAYRAQWSPDGNRLAVQRANGQIFAYDRKSNATYPLGEASSVVWEDNENLVITRSERINEIQVSGASVIRMKFDGTNVSSLIDLTDNVPVYASVSNGKLLVSYATGVKRGITAKAVSADAVKRGAPARETSVLAFRADDRIGSQNVAAFAVRPDYTKMTEEEIELHEEAIRKSAPDPRKGNSIGLTAIPYINQVYDTPAVGGNYNYGYVCCAPTSSCMMLAYHGLLNKNNWTASRASANPSKGTYYSFFIAKKYTSAKTGYTFSTTASGGGYWGYSYGVAGGYGYMWGNGSPASMMASFHTRNGEKSSSFASSYSTFSTECNANRPYIICLNNGTGGHVVCAFRYNQYANGNGTASYSKTGTFVCHDPYGDYNGSSYPNWDGRYSSYDLPGYSNGFKNIGNFYWGCKTTPPSSSSGTTDTTNPTITVNPETVNFKCTVGEHPSTTVTVTAKDLTDVIKVASFTPGRFTPSVSELPKTGGKFTITFNQSDKAGTYKQGGTAVDASFYVKVTSGKIEKIINITADVSAPPLSGITQKYNYSATAGNATAHKEYDATKIRNFCYNNGKLYCVYNSSSIIVLNAQTGAYLGTLSNGTVVKGGDAVLADVKVIDNVIVASNIAGSGKELRIYAWESDTAQPYLLHSTTDLKGAARMGDCLEMRGTFASDLVIAFANDDNTTTRIVEFNRKDGKWTSTVTPVVTSAKAHLATGATTRVYTKTNGWWIDGISSQPTWTTLDATTKSAVQQTTCDVTNPRGSSHHEFQWNGEKYAANIFFDSNAGAKGRMRIVKDTTGNFHGTDGKFNATVIGYYPEAGLGAANTNTGGTGDIAINTDGEKYWEGWVMITGQGLAYFASGSVPAQNPSPFTPTEVVTPDPVITVSETAVSLSAQTGQQTSKKITVKGTNLRANITAKLGGNDTDVFTISPTTLSADGEITINYHPTVAGTHTATITLATDGGKSVTVNLTGTATTPTVKGSITAEGPDEQGRMWFSATSTTSEFMEAGCITRVLTVKGSNINGKIAVKLEGTNASDVHMDVTELPAEGGSVVLNYIPTIQTNNSYVTPTVTLSAANADNVVVSLKLKYDGTKVDTGTTTPQGTLSVDIAKKFLSCISSTSDFVSQGYREFTLTVTGKDIDGNITMYADGDTDNEITITPSTLDAAGGPVVVRYTPTVKRTTTHVTIKADADNADAAPCDLIIQWDGTQPSTGGGEVVGDGTITISANTMKLGDGTTGVFFTSKDGASATKEFKLTTENVSGDITYEFSQDANEFRVYPQTLPSTGGTFTIIYYPTKKPTGRPKLTFKAANATSETITCVTAWDGTPCGVEDITVDADNDGVSYYTLQGVKVEAENLVPGLYIRRQGGKSTKVVIK